MCLFNNLFLGPNIKLKKIKVAVMMPAVIDYFLIVKIENYLHNLDSP